MQRMTDQDRQREAMVQRQLLRRGIRDERVLDAIQRIPRELFVPGEYRMRAYEDGPLAIGFEQTISQPYIAALMCEVLELDGSERVLDVGTGSGYQAALLSLLCREVISIELIPELADRARRNLDEAGLAGRVRVVTGDGSQGFLPGAPYDAICVAAGAPDVPAPLLGQLRDPGRMVIPVGSMGDQDLEVIAKHQGRLSKRVATMCRFVPLRGDRGWKD